MAMLQNLERAMFLPFIDSVGQLSCLRVATDSPAAGWL